VLGRSEPALILAILAIAGVAHGVNMLGCPQYDHDEGVFMARAWSFVTRGTFDPYTFTYDQTPLGYALLGVWARLVGGFNTFGTAVDTGRVLMLVLQLLSTLLVYGIARQLSKSQIVGAQAALLFALSPFGIYFHRPVHLDNISTFWMLLSLRLLVVDRLSSRWLILSAVALGASILSKIPTTVMIPALAYLVFLRSRGSLTNLAGKAAGATANAAGSTPHALRTATIWSTIVTGVVSLYGFYALARGELIPAPGRQSFLGGLRWQASRGRDAGIFDFGSSFWQHAIAWRQAEPLLVVAGTCGAILCIVAGRRRSSAPIGIAVFSFWALYARGGVVEAYYLIPALPLLAISLSLGCHIILEEAAVAGEPGRWIGRVVASAAVRRTALRGWWIAVLLAGFRGPGLAVVRLAMVVAARAIGVAARGLRAPQVARGLARDPVDPRILLAAVSLATMLTLGFTAGRLGFQWRPMLLWDEHRTSAQRAVVEWVKTHVPTTATVIVEPYVWTDLHDGERGGRVWPDAYLYIPAEHNRKIREGILHDDWRPIDYVVGGRRLIDFAWRAPHPRFVEEILVAEALKHSSVVAAFDSPTYPVWVYRVHGGRDRTSRPPSPAES
jgi:hypothetical protein